MRDFVMKEDRFGADNGGETIGTWQVPNQRRSPGSRTCNFNA